jgi:hypothetical protein
MSLLIAVAAIVLLVLLFVVIILRMLKSIGGVPTAEVRATLKGLGGSLGVTGAGLIGSFLAIAILAFVAIYVLAKMIRP